MYWVEKEPLIRLDRAVNNSPIFKKAVADYLAPCLGYPDGSVPDVGSLPGYATALACQPQVFSHPLKISVRSLLVCLAKAGAGGSVYSSPCAPARSERECSKNQPDPIKGAEALLTASGYGKFRYSRWLIRGLILPGGFPYSARERWAVPPECLGLGTTHLPTA